MSADDRRLFLVTGEDGQARGMLDIDAIDSAATILAFDLAAVSHDAEAVQAVLAAALQTQGPGGFGYVAASALRIVVEDVVEPLLQVADRAVVHDLRRFLRESAEHARQTLGGES